MLIPGTAWAAPGDASARGVVFTLDAGVLGPDVVTANRTIGAADAPPTPGTDTDTAIDVAPGLIGTFGVTSTGTVQEVTATRGATASTALARVTGASIGILGVQAIATGDVIATATCPQTGALAAATTVTGLLLFGVPTAAPAPNTAGVTRGVGVTVPGLTAATLTATVTRVETVTEPTAVAVALTTTFTLTGNVAGVQRIIPLGTVTIASATCQRPEAAPAPTVTGIDPDTGPTAGGTTVTIGGTSATDIVVAPDGNSLTAVTPAHAAGRVNVAVTTPAGTDTLPDAFTHLAPPAAPPTVNTIAPTTGPTAGGTPVTITGTGFVPGQTTVTFDGAPATNVVVAADGTSLTAVTPPGTAGPANVAVTTPSGTDTLPGGFTYIAPGGGSGSGSGSGSGGSGSGSGSGSGADSPAPTLSALTPSRGPTAGGQTVVITGSGFRSGATTVTFDGVEAASVAVVDDDTLVVRTPPGTAGSAAVVVTVDGVASDPLTYTYVAGARVPAAPTATALDPDSGPTGGGTDVTVTGTGFVAGQTSVIVCDTTLLPDDVTVAADGESLSFSTPACAAGSTDVVVVTPGGVTTALPFTYTADGTGSDGSGVGGGSSDGSLPNTGADVLRISLLGIALLVGGAVLAVAARRRTDSEPV